MRPLHLTRWPTLSCEGREPDAERHAVGAGLAGPAPCTSAATATGRLASGNPRFSAGPRGQAVERAGLRPPRKGARVHPLLGGEQLARNDIEDRPHEHRDEGEHEHRGGALHRDTMVGARERQREEYGGFNIGAAFFGWLVATGLAVLLTAFSAQPAPPSASLSSRAPRPRAARTPSASSAGRSCCWCC